MSLPLQKGDLVRIGRVYDPPTAGDRRAVLVDRLWPRGIRKDHTPFDQWLRTVAPSSGLRGFYAQRLERFDEFTTRYRTELASDEDGGFCELVRIARCQPVTLLTATRDLEHSGATVLADELRRALVTTATPRVTDGVLALNDILDGADGHGVVWGLDRHHGVNVNLVRLGTGDKIASHVNDDVDVVLVGVTGSGVVTVDGDERFLTRGSLSLVARGAQRSIAALDAPFCYLHPRRTPRSDDPHALAEKEGQHVTALNLAVLEVELVEQIADGVVIADHGGVIISWNHGATAIFGYSAEEAVGQRLDLIIPERLRGRHWAGYDATMASGATTYADRMLAVPALHRDGRLLSVEFRVALLGVVGGRPTAIGAVIRDVTERWHAERQLRARLAELEAPGDSSVAE